jgi:hypothetical protein
MYLRNPAVYKWAGMAALTSAAVGRGMYMIHYLKQSRMGLMVGLFGRLELTYRTDFYRLDGIFCPAEQKIPSKKIKYHTATFKKGNHDANL